MALLEEWRAYAYDQQADQNKMQAFWADYFQKEKGVYEQLLENPDEEVRGTVKEVDAKADWLYNLSQWEKIYDEETRKQFYLEAKKMNTIVKPKKIGRNEPCPCGSGKKYKQCHGRTKELEAELQEMLAQQAQE